MTSSPTAAPASPLLWPAEAIWEAVAPTLPGFTVEVLPEIDSTNSELMRRFRGSAGAPPRPEPLLLVAEQQTAGRGRSGRSWESRRSDSLTFSLGLPLQPADWSGLSLAVGISLAESLDPRTAGPPAIGLKWPNDLWLRSQAGESERKLAGILVETASWGGIRYVVIGVGINILPVQLSAPTSGSPATMAPGCLQELLPGVDAGEALLRALPPLVQAVQAFEQFGFAPFQARFAARDVLAGRAVKLSDGTEGTAHGVSESGALLVHTAAGMKEITSSEVSVRPVSAAQDSRPC
ncbi:biotin--[acetyl-CoA-carboxylase] ligase [Polaromonas sp. JS666]|uniref:biotin--[acetyl-CoA-carboxylase] ligase n=1 Tax=Polaromonas sp. (strain JS666 / ATCC BAA-500) TaxID=296591 RepID=UPI0000D5B46C|nr:biotin--[acetyl-CoA-carboxylase] ligase [Polaromonas sp. JS666]ABE46596.1 Biotin--acetyl-CoA-carboxylase ligase [Polaromonas sp. JS666]